MSTPDATQPAARPGPYGGVVIADLTHALSGPFCVAQAAEDPQTAARNMIVRAGRTRVLGNPIKMSTLPDPPERPGAPALDAQGADIRRELARRPGERRNA